MERNAVSVSVEHTAIFKRAHGVEVAPYEGRIDGSAEQHRICQATGRISLIKIMYAIDLIPIHIGALRFLDQHACS